MCAPVSRPDQDWRTSRIRNTVKGPHGAPESRLALRATALWAFLISRIYEAFPLACPNCGNAMGLIAFVTKPASVAQILAYLDLPSTSPPLTPARDPPLDDAEQARAFDPTAAEPVPDFEFHQRVSSWSRRAALSSLSLNGRRPDAAQPQQLVRGRHPPQPPSGLGGPPVVTVSGSRFARPPTPDQGR